jgi:hypothetical protein
MATYDGDAFTTGMLTTYGTAVYTGKAGALFQLGAGPDDETAPTLTLVSTPASTYGAYVVSVGDALGILDVTLVAHLGGLDEVVVYRDGAFRGAFADRSTRTGAGTIGDPYVYTVYRRGGWPVGVEITIYRIAVDTSGNRAV